MIEPVINELLNDEDIAQKYNLNKSTVSYILISKSPYRNYLHSRFNYTILSGACPVLCVRFYNDKNSNTRLEREFDIQRTIHTKYKNLQILAPHRAHTLRKSIECETSVESILYVILHNADIFLVEDLLLSEWTNIKS